MISVDFTELYRQIERLEKFRIYLEELIGRIDEVIRSLSDMELADTLDELRIIRRGLIESTEEVQKNIYKLRKILEIFNECELWNAKSIDDLPIKIPDSFNSGTGAAFSLIPLNFDRFINLKTNSFENHLIINDDWLNELIY